MPIYIPAWIEASVNGIYNESDAQANVLSFAAAAEHPTDAELASVAALLANWALTSYKGIISEQVRLTTVHVRDQSQPDGSVADADCNALGVLAGDALPANAAACVSLRTTRGGRRGRGRMFLMTTSELFQQQSIWEDAYLSAIQTDITALEAAATANGTPWVVASRADAALHAVQSWIIRPFVCSQRDRLPFHRRHRAPRTP